MERIARWYHLMALRKERRDIVRDDRDQRDFLELLEEAPSRFALL